VSESIQGESAPTRHHSLWAILSFVVFVVLAGVYLFTGTDPLGLFKPTAEVPPASPTVSPLPTVPGSKGDWWHVHFTDPNAIRDPDDLHGSVAEKLIEYIDNTENTIDIAAFEFESVPVAEALIAASKRGVDVRWVTDDEYGMEEDIDAGHRLFPRLRRAGASVRDDQRRALMHNKFWIFDGRIVWTGSTNITVNGFFRNSNNVLVIESPEVAEIYEREFAEMWRGEFGPTSPSTVEEQSVIIGGTPIQILFAPEDEAISRLVSLVKSAQSSVRFMAFSFTHNALGDAVLVQSRKGVDVKGIFGARGSETDFSELRIFHCAMIPVRQDSNPGTFHHKVLVIDEQIVVTGSLNFSENADESNDENVIIVTDPSLAAEYLQEFERHWATASVPSQDDIDCR
jgi:phosphatidylserine/phosphatidylglycerophosphate/cardiolipin synthase-like enzyme